jgi:quercetin dioxygenase-like cupin family protein
MMMVIKELGNVPSFTVDGFDGIKKQIVLGDDDGSSEMIMRHFALEPGASTPYHQHPYPHMVMVTGGSGVLIDADKAEHRLASGEYAYVEDDEVHGFKNNTESEFSFICIVPARGEA